MAKDKGVPQLENGFARVANEILEAMARTALSDYESRCIHFLWRKTYGWQDQSGESKKVDSISHSQWSTGTGITRRHIHRVLDRLVQRNILTKLTHYNRNKKIILWGFQKRYNEWLTPLFEPPAEEVSLPPIQAIVEPEPSPEEVMSGVQPSPAGGQLPPIQGAKLPPIQAHTKDNKDTNTKDQQHPDNIERQILDIFKSLKGWGYDYKEDLIWLREIREDYPSATADDFKGCRDWHSKRPAPKNKGPWQSRFRNWLRRKVEGKGIISPQRPGKVPTTSELKQQAIKKGVV